MKKTIIGLFLLGFMFQANAQNVLFEAKLKKEEVPDAIIESVNETFPNYDVEEFTAIPVDFVEDDVVVDRNITSNNDYNTYQITLKGKDETLVATYNKSGKLLSTIENGKDVVPPVSVTKAAEKAYPDWIIKKDRYKMIHYKGDKKIERYKLILEKGKKKKRIYTDAKGKILDY